MDVINKCFSGLFMLIVFAAPGNCFAQKKPAAQSNQRPLFYFDKPITLDSLTKYVHSRSKIRFSFNSSKVKGDKLINLKKGTYSIESLLQQIRKNTSLYYSMYNGYVIFQDNPPKPKATPRPVVKKNNTKPPPRNVNVLSHHQPAANSNKEKNSSPPAREPGRLSIKNTPSADTIKRGTHSSPDSLNRAVVIDSIAPIDTLVTYGRLPVYKGSAKPGDEKSGWYWQFGLPWNTPIPADTPVKYDRQPVQKTTAGKPSVAPPTTGKKKESASTYRSQKGNAKAGDEKAGWDWQYGLHWKGAIPLYGSDHYFTGPDTHSQPYNLLIPGVWLSSRFNEKHEVLLLVKPAEWYLYNNAIFRHDTGFKSIGVDTVAVLRSDRLVKTSGLYAALQYNYHINENWMIGAGIGYHSRGRSLLLQQSKRLFDSAHSESIPDSLISVKNDSLTSKYLNPSIITGKFEIAYRYGSVDLGATLLLPLTNPFTSQSNNQSRPINVQLFVRWRIKRSNLLSR
jgi:hypothetical protein